MEKKNQEEMQKRYVELQMLEAQMKQMQRQLEAVENNMADLTLTKQNIDSVRGIRPGTEILVPVSSGIFIKGSLKENSELLVNVGANTVVNKSVEDTKSLLDGQMEEIVKFREQLMAALQKLESRAVQLEKELASLLEQ